METSDELQQEIKELESQSEDMLTSPERKRTLEIEVHLLKNGYRIIPIGLRILGIQNSETGQIVYETTYNELLFARLTPQLWLKIAQENESK